MPKNTIDLATAQEWARTWIATPDTNVKAHLIPQVNITQLMESQDCQDIRAYMGIDGDGVARLMLVAVDVNGNDLIDEAKGHYIYDFTTPCPLDCDVNSPLYTLI